MCRLRVERKRNRYNRIHDANYAPRLQRYQRAPAVPWCHRHCDQQLVHLQESHFYRAGNETAQEGWESVTSKVAFHIDRIGLSNHLLQAKGRTRRFGCGDGDGAGQQLYSQLGLRSVELAFTFSSYLCQFTQSSVASSRSTTVAI